MGNLNFTYIVNRGEFGDYDGFTKTLRDYINEELGLCAYLSGRNDLLIDGRKFSGNAQYFYKGRLLHHGTILLGADMTRLARALKPDEDKILSKGIKSVRSRVANLSEFTDISAQEFKKGFGQRIIRETGAEVYTFTKEDIEEIKKLADTKYSTYEWNFGYSPKYTFRKKSRFAGGSIEVLMDIQDGIIENMTLFGDFFAKEDLNGLTEAFKGCKHENSELFKVISSLCVEKYIREMTGEEFLSCVI